jgi:hypothetical protein
LRGDAIHIAKAENPLMAMPITRRVCNCHVDFVALRAEVPDPAR